MARARASAAVRGEAVQDIVAVVESLVVQFRSDGLTCNNIAKKLNGRGFNTWWGRLWSATAVWRPGQRLG